MVGNYPEKRYLMASCRARGRSFVGPAACRTALERTDRHLAGHQGRPATSCQGGREARAPDREGASYDPGLTEVDPQSETAHRDLIWGKSYFVLEELERTHVPGHGEYFAASASRGRERLDYTMDDCVAIWVAESARSLPLVPFPRLRRRCLAH